MSAALQWTGAETAQLGAAVPLRLWPLEVRSPRVAPRLVTYVDAPLRAAELADVPQLLQLLDGFARRGLLLPRSAEQVYRQFREFTVAVSDDGVVGSVALRVYSPELAEVAGLAVSEHLHGQGLGRRLVETAVAQARALGIRRVFALTLHPDFFHRCGFRTTSVAAFPQKLEADCAGCARRAACAEVAVVMELNA